MVDAPLDIHFFAYYDRKQKFATPCQAFSEPMLFCVKSGNFRYRIGDSDWFIAEENAIVLCPADTPFCGEIAGSISLVVAKFSTNTPFPLVAHPIYPDVSRVRDNLKQLSQAGFLLTDQPSHEICHYVTDLYYMARSIMPSPKLPLQEIYEYICAHFCEEISINALAQRYGHTPPRLIAIFNKHYGAPPKNIILHKRITKAKSLLLQTDLSVGEISLECGYKDTLYFSRIFSKYCGCSPSTFRKQNDI